MGQLVQNPSYPTGNSKTRIVQRALRPRMQGQIPRNVGPIPSSPAINEATTIAPTKVPKTAKIKNEPMKASAPIANSTTKIKKEPMHVSVRRAALCGQ